MRKEDEKYRNYLQILQEELIPAMGCTEPIAIAYAAAKAKELLGEIPTSVIIEASGNIVKNVKSVVVPNTGGLKGIEAAAAAGIVAGRPELSLEVISGIWRTPALLPPQWALCPATAHRSSPCDLWSVSGRMCRRRNIDWSGLHTGYHVLHKELSYS